MTEPIFTIRVGVVMPHETPETAARVAAMPVYGIGELTEALTWCGKRLVSYCIDAWANKR